MRPLALSTILVATDMSPASDVALESGYRLATAAGASLHVVHVQERSPRAEAAGSWTEPATPGMVEVLRRAGVPEGETRTEVLSGSPADAIRAFGEEIGADVVVVGAPRRGARGGDGQRLGGTARAIMAEAFVPCLAIVRPLQLPLERVLVPADLSDTARGALLVALSWTSALRARASEKRTTALTALHVEGAEGDGARETSRLEKELDRLRRRAGGWAGVEIHGVTIGGTDAAAEAIATYARDHHPDLLVMGTRGLSLDEAARLGSVSGSVVERSPAPVLLVPPPVWRAFATES